MKLYYSPGACSLAPHIALRESGLAFELDRVDFATKRTASGADFNAINPKSQVPTLGLDDGQILTEVAAVLQYIADLAPAANLAPAPGGLARARLQETLNQIATEIHKGFSPLFSKECPDAWKAVVLGKLQQQFAAVDATLATRPFFAGDTFSVADAYLFTVLGWTRFLKLDLAPYPHVVAYLARIAERPAVQAALVAEGLRRA